MINPLRLILNPATPRPKMKYFHSVVHHYIMRVFDIRGRGVGGVNTRGSGLEGVEGSL